MSETFNPDALAWFDSLDDAPAGYQYVDASMIRDHIVRDRILPVDLAGLFAEHADDTWNEYNDGSGTQTNDQILDGVLAYWRGE